MSYAIAAFVYLYIFNIYICTYICIGTRDLNVRRILEWHALHSIEAWHSSKLMRWAVFLGFVDALLIVVGPRKVAPFGTATHPLMFYWATTAWDQMVERMEEVDQFHIQIGCFVQQGKVESISKVLFRFFNIAQKWQDGTSLLRNVQNMFWQKYHETPQCLEMDGFNEELFWDLQKTLLENAHPLGKSVDPGFPAKPAAPNGNRWTKVLSPIVTEPKSGLVKRWDFAVKNAEKSAEGISICWCKRHVNITKNGDFKIDGVSKERLQIQGNQGNSCVQVETILGFIVASWLIVTARCKIGDRNVCTLHLCFVSTTMPFRSQSLLVFSGSNTSCSWGTAQMIWLLWGW